jgi:hypothetical protein
MALPSALTSLPVKREKGLVTSYYVVFVQPDGTLGKRKFPTLTKASNFHAGAPGASLLLEVSGSSLRMLDMVRPDKDPEEPS